MLFCGNRTDDLPITSSDALPLRSYRRVVEATPLNYNPGQNCWGNSRLSLSPHYHVNFSLSPKSRLVHRSLECFNIVWEEVGRKRQQKKNTSCSYNDGNMYSKFSSFRPNLTSVPESFDPDCRSISSRGISASHH